MLFSTFGKEYCVTNVIALPSTLHNLIDLSAETETQETPSRENDIPYIPPL